MSSNVSTTNYNSRAIGIVELSPDTSFPELGGITARPAGTRLTLINTSVNSQLLCDELTATGQAATAVDRFAFNGYDYPLFGKSSVDIVYSGTLSRWVIPSSQRAVIPSPRFGGYKGWNFYTNAPPSFTGTAASGGSISNFGGSGVANHPGVLEYTLGTSTTGSGSMWISTTRSALFGNSVYWRTEWVIKVLQLANVTDNYTLRVGFIQSNTAESSDAAMFRYNYNVNGGKWERVTINNTSVTATDTGATVGTTNWTRLTIIVNAARTNVEFFVDGVSVGSNTTNIPANNRPLTEGFMFLKSAGTTDTAFLDIGSMETIIYFNKSN